MSMLLARSDHSHRWSSPFRSPSLLSTMNNSPSATIALAGRVAPPLRQLTLGAGELRAKRRCDLKSNHEVIQQVGTADQ